MCYIDESIIGPCNPGVRQVKDDNDDVVDDIVVVVVVSGYDGNGVRCASV